MPLLICVCPTVPPPIAAFLCCRRRSNPIASQWRNADDERVEIHKKQHIYTFTLLSSLAIVPTTPVGSIPTMAKRSIDTLSALRKLRLAAPSRRTARAPVRLSSSHGGPGFGSAAASLSQRSGRDWALMLFGISVSHGTR
jgi:hypothetical protein